MRVRKRLAAVCASEPKSTWGHVVTWDTLWPSRLSSAYTLAAGSPPARCSRQRGVSSASSEVPLLDLDGIARLYLGLRRRLNADHAAVGVEALEVEVVLARPVGVAAGHRDSLKRRHVGDVGVAAGFLNLADHIERPARDDFGADAGIPKIVRIELGDDCILQLFRGLAVCVDIADEREGQHAVAVERVFAGQRRLAEDDNADAV